MSQNLGVSSWGLPISRREMMIAGGVLVAGLLIFGSTPWGSSADEDSVRRRRSTVFSRYGDNIDDKGDVLEVDDSDDSDADTVVDEPH